MEFNSLILKIKNNAPDLKCAEFILERISDDQANELASALHKNTRLTDVKLSDVTVSDAGLHTIMQALLSHQNLTTLSIFSIKMDLTCVKALVNALENDVHLTILNLSHIQISTEGILLLVNGLRTNTRLKTLCLNNNKVEPESAKAIADLLKINNTIEHLELTDNQMGDESAQHMAEVLQSTKTLRTCIFTSDKITCVGATALAHALRYNTSITSLCLDGNPIGDKGASQIAETLKINTRLKRIFLDNCQIVGLGAKALGQSLFTNKTVTDLRLTSNQFGEYGANALVAALKNNTTISWLSYNQSAETKPHCEYLASLMPFNYTLSNWSDDPVLKNFHYRNLHLSRALNKLILTGVMNEVSILAFIQTIKEQTNLCQSFLIPKTEMEYLFAAIRCMSRSESEQDALYWLTKPFYNKPVRKIALCLLGHLLQTSQHINTPAECNPAVNQLSLLCFSKFLNSDAIHHLAYITLCKLMDPFARHVTFAAKDKAQHEIALMRYRELLWMMQAVKESGNSDEQRLLRELAKQRDYHLTTVEYLLQCPSFVRVFRKKFPTQSRLAITEHCFMQDLDNAPLTLLTIPTEFAPINEQTILEYRQALNANPSTAIKLAQSKAIEQLFDTSMSKEELIQSLQNDFTTYPKLRRCLVKYLLRNESELLYQDILALWYNGAPEDLPTKLAQAVKNKLLARDLPKITGIYNLFSHSTSLAHRLLLDSVAADEEVLKTEQSLLTG